MDPSTSPSGDPAAVLAGAEVERRASSAKYALEHAADAAACCLGRHPDDVLDDAVRVADAGAHEVWQLHEALPVGSDTWTAAAAAYAAAADGTRTLQSAASVTSGAGPDADAFYDAAWHHFQHALTTLGW